MTESQTGPKRSSVSTLLEHARTCLRKHLEPLSEPFLLGLAVFKTIELGVEVCMQGTRLISKDIEGVV